MPAGLVAGGGPAWVLDEVVEVTAAGGRREELIRNYVEQQKVSSDDELAAWLERKRLSFEDLRYFATSDACSVGCNAVTAKKQNSAFWNASSTSIRWCTRSFIGSQDLAEELHQRLREEEADFPDLAKQFSEGAERQSRGQVGPSPLTAGSPSW